MRIGDFFVGDVEGVVVGHHSTVTFGSDLDPGERLAKEAAHFLELGRTHLATGRFRDAIASFSKAIASGDVGAEVYYYRALAKIVSRDPGTLSARRAQSIEDDITCAAAGGVRGHHLVLRVYLRLAHHRKLGLRAPHPPLQELLQDIRRLGIGKQKMKELLAFRPLRELLTPSSGSSPSSSSPRARSARARSAHRGDR